MIFLFLLGVPRPSVINFGSTAIEKLVCERHACVSNCQTRSQWRVSVSPTLYTSTGCAECVSGKLVNKSTKGALCPSIVSFSAVPGKTYQSSSSVLSPRSLAVFR